jgi:hypothetical protein
MSYRFPKMTVELIEELPQEHRKELLKVLIKTFNIANEKLGFKVTPEALYVNEPEVMPQVREIRSIEEADAILNALANNEPLPAQPQPNPEPQVQVRQRLQVQESNYKPSCDDLVLQKLNRGACQFTELWAHIQVVNPKLKEKTLRDTLWRLRMDGKLSKGQGKRPFYRLTTQYDQTA